MTASLSSEALVQSWHQLSAQETIERLNSDPKTGLRKEVAEQRQEEFGPNHLTPDTGTSPWMRFWQQFNQPLLYILLIAGGITLLLQDWIDAGVIFAVVLINAIIGYIQEAKAEHAMEALAQSFVAEATVMREGKQQQLPAAQLVPGDLVWLEAGDKVPADLRLIETKNLHCHWAGAGGIVD